MSKRLTSKQIADLYSTDTRTVRLWIKKGLPSIRRKVKGAPGSPRHMFDVDEVHGWCAANGVQLLPKTDEAHHARESLAVPVTDAERATEADLNTSGIVGSIIRLRAMEKKAFARWVTAMDEGLPETTQKARQTSYIDTAKALQAMADKLPGILEKQGEMIPIETVLQEQAKIDLAVKNELLTLPRAIAGDIADITDANEIEQILQDKIDDCLRHIRSGTTVPQ